jgi:hypothetical protein
MQCKKCRETKEASQFWANNTVCIECNKKAWRERATPEKRREWLERQRKFDDLNIARYLLRQARKRAKAKGLECTIKPSDIHVGERCPVLGIQMVKNRGHWQNNSYSLDRIDSSRGYVKGNVRVISWWANFLKSNLTLEQAENLVKYMKGEL